MPHKGGLLRKDMSFAGAAGTDEIKFWIMSWGSKALILEPESLKDEIRAEAEAMIEKYAKETEKEERPLTA